LHIVEEGETIYSISQLYGIKQKWLYKRNRLDESSEIKTGDKLFLRGKKPRE